MPNPGTRKDPRDLFLRHVEIGLPSDCWPWLAAINKETGYGVFCVAGKTMSAHRAAHLLFVDDELDPTLDVHHHCDSRSCVNWFHLEPTTRQHHLSELTPASFAYKNKRKTHCPKGHEITGVIPTGRICLICRTASLKASSARRNQRRRLHANDA